MINPKLLIQVIDNDPKGLVGGTLYLVTYSLNELGNGSIEYQVNKPSYNDYEKIYSLYIQEKIQYDVYQKDLYETELKKAKESRLKENCFSDQLVLQIKEHLSEYSELIAQYKDGKDKALNSIVGRSLKHFQSKSIALDPLVLKETILKII